MSNYRRLGVLILSLMMLSVFAAVNVTALSETNDSIGDVPDLPLILHGGLDFNGQPAPAGSELTAYYEGELIAKSMIEEEGQYTLNLNLTPENYTNVRNVELYVNGNKTSFEIPASGEETIKNAVPGSVAEVDIVFSASSNETDTGSGGGGDSTGEAKIMKKDTAESTPGSEPADKDAGSSEAGFAGEDEDDINDAEGPVSQAGDEEDKDIEDAEGAGGTEDAGYSTVFTALLFIAALFGAFMLIKR